MLNFYKIENNYPMTYSGDKPLDESWKEFTVLDGVYEPKELDDCIKAIEAKEYLAKAESEVQRYIDETAKSLGYDNISSIGKYLGYDNPFRLECEKLGKFNADCWIKAFELQQDGTVYSIEEILYNMPKYNKE